MAEPSLDTSGQLAVPDCKNLVVKDARSQFKSFNIEVTNPAAATSGSVEDSKIKENAPTSPPGTPIMSGGIVSVVIHSL